MAAKSAPGKLMARWRAAPSSTTFLESSAENLVVGAARIEGLVTMLATTSRHLVAAALRNGLQKAMFAPSAASLGMSGSSSSRQRALGCVQEAVRWRSQTAQRPLASYGPTTTISIISTR
eukprot:1732861-Amphidinium_carterae.1